MDVDLDERRGLAGCARCTCDAETPQLYQTNYAFLRGLQLPQQVIQRGRAHRSSSVILDRYLLIWR